MLFITLEFALQLAPSAPATSQTLTWNCESDHCSYGGTASSYTAKLAVHPHHPSYFAVFRPSVHYRYKINIRVSWPVCVWFQHLLDSLHANVSHELCFADVLPFHSGLSVALFVICFLLNTQVVKRQSFSAVITLQRQLYVNCTV